LTAACVADRTPVAEGLDDRGDAGEASAPEVRDGATRATADIADDAQPSFASRATDTAPAGDETTAPVPSVVAGANFGADLGYPGWEPRTPQRGWLILFQSVGSSMGRHQIEFFTGDDPAAGRACEFRSVGPCVLRSCAPASGSPRQSFVYAGRLSISGERSGRVSYPPQVVVNTPYYNRHHQGKTWHHDDPFTIALAGGVVPAHEARVRFPARPADITIDGAFSRSAGGTLRWSLPIGTTGELVVMFAARSGATQVTCSGPNEARELRLPGEAIAQLPPGPAALKLRSAAWTNLRAGEFRIYAEARQEYADLTVDVSD
jgi:hypothetical protein